MLTEEQKEQLDEAQEYCDETKKSTEFMLEYMQDIADCTLDEVLAYLEGKDNE